MTKPDRKGGSPAGRSNRGRPADNPMAKAIGRQLRDMYDETLNEPVPKELSDLVARLAKHADKSPKR